MTERGYPPTRREIVDAVGLALTSSMDHQLRQLQAKGYLGPDPSRTRALAVLDGRGQP